MIGKIVSHYKILEKLGSGGMGVVYKAEDLKLKRTVALKFLPQDLSQSEQAKKRFLYEAQTASALDHAHVGTIYEIDETADGQIFIAMAHYAGETLKDRIERGPLAFKQAVKIAVQIAEGLAKAHRKDIIHRDIKPANILLTEDDQVKIVDFGLAKFLKGSQLTKTRQTSGTLAYMSPEHVQGLKVDHRTDIWSFAVVLYEMLTGGRPFSKEYDQAIIYSILNEEPEPLSDNLSSGFPLEVARLLEKGLAKSPEERYRDMNEVLNELRLIENDTGQGDSKVTHTLRTKRKSRWGLYGGLALTVLMAVLVGFFALRRDESIPKPVGIAVLPIKSFSDAGEPDWFRESLTDALITDLSRISGLSVTSLSTVMRFKDSDKQVSEIAEELDVTYVLESSIIRVGETVRLSTKLIDASQDMNVWAESFNRSSQNVLALQSELAATIAKQVQVNLTSEEEAYLLAAPTIDAAAQEAYLKGRYFLIQRTDRALETAVRYFEEAIELEPKYSSAHAGLAMTYSVWPWYSGSPLKDVFVKAKDAAQRGLELDRRSAEANLAFAFATLQGDLFWSEPELEGRFKDAIRQKPSYSAAHQYYGWFLFYTGRFEESRAVLARAKELDPLSVAIEVDIGWTHHFEREYEHALRAYEDALVLEPNYALTYYHMAATHLAADNPGEAVSAATTAMELGGRTPAQLAMLAAAYARQGEQHRALTLQTELFDLEDRGHDVTLDLALVYLALTAYDETLTRLESALEAQNSKLRLVQIEPLWDPIRSDRRFVELAGQLVRKVGPTLN